MDKWYTGLTNGDLIEILSQRDPYDTVDIEVDISVDIHTDYPDIYPEYPELTEDDGLSLNKMTGQLVIRKHRR